MALGRCCRSVSSVSRNRVNSIYDVLGIPFVFREAGILAGLFIMVQISQKEFFSSLMSWKNKLECFKLAIIFGQTY
jgi:hypothetical protein